MTAIANDLEDGWVEAVLKFWFEQATPEQWFEKDPAFDAAVRERFLPLHEVLLSNGMTSSSATRGPRWRR